MATIFRRYPLPLCILGCALVLLPRLSWAGQAYTIDTVADNMQVVCQPSEPAGLYCQFRPLIDSGELRLQVSLENRPLRHFTIRQYPYETAISAILLLVDTSSGQHPRSIAARGRHLATLLERAAPHHRLGLAGFDQDLDILVPIGVARADLLQSMARMQIRDKDSSIYDVLLDAINILAFQNADRRAIILLSDGIVDRNRHNHDEVVQAARQAGVTITSLGYADPDLEAALTTLQRLSAETGGAFLASDADWQLPAEFLASPYTGLDAGGRIDIDLSAEVDDGHNGERRLVFRMLDPDGPVARALVNLIPRTDDLKPSPGGLLRDSAAAHLPGTHPGGARGLDTMALVVLSAGLAFITVGMALVWRRLRRRMGKRKPAAPLTSSRTTYYLIRTQSHGSPPVAVQGASLTIGRSSGNGMRLDDPSVSRHHARIEQRVDGSYAITDLDSLNGVYVNDRQVRSAFLQEHDLVEIGDIKLRFTSHPEPDADHGPSSPPAT